MLTRASKRRKRDPNLSAFDTLKQIIAEHDPEPPDPGQLREAAATMSKAGAAKGGHARAAKLSPRKRAEIAKKAAAARWKKNG